jgi:uncharacterized protein (TIGR03437 family)
MTLAFAGVAGAPGPNPQTINISSQLSGLAFTVSSDSTWLTLNSSSGAMPATLQVSVDSTRLTPNIYKGTITVNVPNAVAPTASIAVTFTVQPAAAQPQLNVGSQSLSFTAVRGADTQTARVQVANTGGGSLSYSAVATTDLGSWLAVSPATGTATPSSPISMTVVATPGALPAGTYQGKVSIRSGENTVTIPVTLSITTADGVILVSQSSLSFTAVAQGGSPLPQTFGILNTGQGSMSWTASSSTVSGGAKWFQLSATSGTVNQPYVDISLIDVVINPNGLAPGDYYGLIEVRAAAANSPQVVTVLLTVLPPGTNPGPEVRPAGLIFTGIAGVTPGSRDVLIANPKGQADSFLSNKIGAGFTYLPTNANVQPTEPATLRVFPDYSNLKPGAIERGTITLQFTDGTARTISMLSVVAPGTASTAAAAERSSILGPRASGCSSPKLEIQFRSLRANFVATVGQGTTIEVQVADDCGNLVGPGSLAGTLVSAGFSNGDGAIKLTHIGNGVWTGTWRPVHTTSGAVTVTVTAFLVQGATTQANQVDLAGTLSTGTTPTVTAGGVVQGASFAAGVPIAPGSLITIYGTNLAEGSGQAAGLPLPQQLNGTQVKIGDRVVPLLYTSTGQMNVQVPFDAPVNTQYQVTVQRGNALSVPESLVIAAAQPGIFTLNQQGTGQGVIMRSDQVTVAKPGTGAEIGETVVIYCTGLGSVTPGVAVGTPAPSSPLSKTVNPVTVTIGGKQAAVQFSGLTPGWAGLYQINAVVPSGVTPGDQVPVVLSMAGQTSPPVVTMAVR